jgi:Family of unknown function (DUF6082)
MNKARQAGITGRWYPRSGITFALLLAALVVLVFASPFAVRWIAGWRFDWNLLSNVGQAYGFAAALLSGLALTAIGISLFYQARQTTIAQLQAARTLQLELLKLAYEHPDLQEGWSRSVDLPYAEWRKRTYMNLVFMYLRMNYVMRNTTDADLHRMMSNRFRTRPGREYWADAHAAFSAGVNNRRDKRFFDVTESEYQKALKTPPLDDPEQKREQRGDLRSVTAFAACGAAVGFLALVIHKWRSRQR